MSTDRRFPLARAIRKSWRGSINKRARYLREIYERASDGSIEKGRYLDIGAETAQVALTFGEEYREIYRLNLDMRWGQEVGSSFVGADAKNLPFKDGVFDLISMFNVIEHLDNPEMALKEASRVLGLGGELAIYLGNRYFPIEPHSGLINLVLLPDFLRRPLLRLLRHSWLQDVNHPSVRTTRRMFKDSGFDHITITKVAYPPEVIPQAARTIYAIVKKLGVLRLMPLGYFCLCKKEAEEFVRVPKRP